MALSIFNEQELKDLQEMHPAYRAVAQEIERVTNSVEFADGLLTVLAAYVRDARDEQDKLFTSMYRHLYEEQ